ncbi:MAG: ferritin-like domain-containing protein [Gemmatimonadetes bacterium]|nr:ferritin-like domain-containing protein [Gemmatimonadota bacterium]
MSKNTPQRAADEGEELLTQLNRPAGRRDFLKWTGVSAATLVAAACDQNETRTITGVRADTTVRADTIIADPQNPSRAPSVTINFANDFGILNYAFALEQLEAAFYTQVVASASFATVFPERERRVLIDLRDHEIIHREFLRTAITALAPAGTIIGNLTPLFTSINFNSRESVLNTARTFEDLGVAAYNGAARFLSSVALVGIAGKIVSVEARHASAIRDLLMPRTNAYAPAAFDDALPPSRVLAAADPFIQNPINATNLPAGA